MENIILNYTILLKGFLDILLVWFVYFVIKSNYTKKKKYTLIGVVLFLSAIVNNINFNFAQNIRLDNQRITNQATMFEKQEKDSPIVHVSNKIQVQNKKTTDYIEKEANKIHNSVKEYQNGN